jgi:hypothetical protein
MPSKDRVKRLLSKLCVELGFCLSPDDNRRLIENPPADPDSFTDAVFRAEGMDPRLHRQLYRYVCDIVAERLFSVCPGPPSERPQC